eukprot:803235-Amorphochlora_amoeboformis.AAC.2
MASRFREPGASVGAFPLPVARTLLPRVPTVDGRVQRTPRTQKRRMDRKFMWRRRGKQVKTWSDLAITPIAGDFYDGTRGGHIY